MLKRRNKILIILLVFIIILSGCNKKEETDAIKFKNEYESYNETLSVLNINDDNPFVYKTQNEIDELINNKETFVVFYGNPQDEVSRSLVETIISESKNSLNKVYYVSGNVNIIGYIKGEEYKRTNNLDDINDIINKISVELSSCDIYTGC